MKLKDIAKKIGAAIVSEVLPGGGLLIDAVNMMLPDDKKLPASATGVDLQSLPPNILDREFDVRIESIKQQGDTTRAMLAAESQSRHTTRPKIALGIHRLLCFIVILVMVIWAYAVIMGQKELLKTILNSWQFILALISPFVVVIHQYFGVLRTEHANRLDSVAGYSTKTRQTGILATLFNK